MCYVAMCLRLYVHYVLCACYATPPPVPGGNGPVPPGTEIHCAECIAARKPTHPLSQMVPLTPLDVLGKTRAPESLTFPAVAHPSAAHAGYLHGATERRLASLEGKFAQLCDAKEAALGLHSKILQRQLLNEQCAIGFLNFNSKPMRIYSSPIVEPALKPFNQAYDAQ